MKIIRELIFWLVIICLIVVPYAFPAELFKVFLAYATTIPSMIENEHARNMSFCVLIWILIFAVLYIFGDKRKSIKIHFLQMCGTILFTYLLVTGIMNFLENHNPNPSEKVQTIPSIHDDELPMTDSEITKSFRLYLKYLICFAILGVILFILANVALLSDKKKIKKRLKREYYTYHGRNTRT